MAESKTVEDIKAITAESMPGVRKAFKALAVGAFAFVWISAMFMTFDVMMVRTEGQPWYAVFGMVALGLGADLWVGAGPVILRASSRWGVKGWAFIGYLTLVVALAFSLSNKIAYWVEQSNERHIEQIAAGVDTLASDRELIAQNPGARVPQAVRAEAAGVRSAIEAKREEIEALPPEWPVRRMRAQRELQQLQQRAANLEGEQITAQAVADARARVDAARVSDAVTAAAPDDDVDPVVQWVIALAAGFGERLTPEQALTWLHAAYSIFHELAQFSFLGLATLRIPMHKMREEQEFIIDQRKLRADRTVTMLQTQIEETTRTKMAEASFKATKRAIPRIAMAEAQLETDRKLRDLARRRRAFEMEDSPYDIPEDRLVADHSSEAKPEQRSAADQAKDVISAVMDHGGTPEWAAHLARSVNDVFKPKEAAQDPETKQFIDYETITYTRRKPQRDKKAPKEAEVGVKVKPRGPKNTRMIVGADGTTTETEAAGDGGASQLATSIPGVPDITDAGGARLEEQPPHQGARENTDDPASNDAPNEADPIHEPSEADEAAVIAAYQTVEPGLFASASETLDEQPADVGAADENERQHEADDDADTHAVDEAHTLTQDDTPDREEPETRPERMIGVAAE